MPWFKVDDGFHSHPKTIGVSLGARGLWVTAGAWCAHHLTDGVLTLAHVQFLGGSEDMADELVEAGLWDVTRDTSVSNKVTYTFHEWTEYQPTRENVQTEREASRERQRRRRAKRQNPKSEPVSVTEASRRDTAVSHAPVTEVFGTPDPTRPDQELPKGSSAPKPPQSSPRKKPAGPLPKDWAPTEEHQRRAAQHRIDLNREAEQFRLHAEANGRTAVNWNAAFTMWLSKSQQFAGKQSTGIHPSATERKDQQFAALAQRRQADFTTRKEIDQ